MSPGLLVDGAAALAARATGREPWKRILAALTSCCALGACSVLPPEHGTMQSELVARAVVPIAGAALEAGQVETARRLYARLLEVAPDSVEARMGLGDVALVDGSAAEAAGWYLAALSRARQADETHAALLAHGRAALAAGDLANARASFSRLADPHEDASDAIRAWAFNGIGIVQLLEGDASGAVASIRQAVRIDDREPRFRGNLARASKLTSSETGDADPAADIAPAIHGDDGVD